MEELEESEKGTGDMEISFSLIDPEDNFLTHWNGAILGPTETHHDRRIENYTSVPPKLDLLVKFTWTASIRPRGKLLRSYWHLKTGIGKWELNRYYPIYGVKCAMMQTAGCVSHKMELCSKFSNIFYNIHAGYKCTDKFLERNRRNHINYF